MTTNNILKSILNIKNIRITNTTFNESNHALYIHVTLYKSAQSRCPICGKKCPGYDHKYQPRTWRHLDFGPCFVYVQAQVRRVSCSEHGVHTEMVPFAHHHTTFTKEFELQLAYVAIHLNRSQVAKLMRVSWNTVGTVLSRAKHRLEPDGSVRFKDLKRIGIDETSYRKGHKYITVITDHDTGQVVWTHPGTGKAVLEVFMKSLSEQQRSQIELVSADGARWIRASVEEWLINAELCIDAFHVVSWSIEAMDACRKSIWNIARTEEKKQPKKSVGRPKKGNEKDTTTKVKKLKSAKYTLGKNPENLSPYQRSCLHEIRTVYPRLFRGYQLKEGLRKVFQCHADEVEIELKRWLSWASRSRIPEFVELSKKIRRHYNGIIATVKHQLSNARIESMNNKIKVLIRKSYGFRNIQNMIDMIMIICSNLVQKIQPAYMLRESTHTL